MFDANKQVHSQGSSFRTKDIPMPLYMDRHEVPDDATPLDIAQAHARDVEVQAKYGVDYITYWFDHRSGAGFCLVEGPSADVVEAVHREAHGLMGSKIIEVDRAAVESFLGHLDRPVTGETFVATAFRAILFTDLVGSTELTHRLGDVAAMRVIRAHDAIVSDAIHACHGRRVKHMGDGVMASFTSVSQAVECAILIQRGVAERNVAAESPFDVRLAISAGEPVTEDNDLFGVAVQLAARVCSTCPGGRILVTSAVRELCLGKDFRFDDQGHVDLKGFDEPMRIYEVMWM
jgi:class 3 adenylate cyclase